MWRAFDWWITGYQTDHWTGSSSRFEQTCWHWALNLTVRRIIKRRRRRDDLRLRFSVLWVSLRERLMLMIVNSIFRHFFLFAVRIERFWPSTSHGAWIHPFIPMGIKNRPVRRRENQDTRKQDALSNVETTSNFRVHCIDTIVCWKELQTVVYSQTSPWLDSRVGTGQEIINQMGKKKHWKSEHQTHHSFGSLVMIFALKFYSFCRPFLILSI